MNWNWIERAAVWMTRYIFRPMLQLALALLAPLLAVLAALCSTLAMGSKAYAMQARSAYCNDGFSPTSMQSGNTPQASLTTHYNKNFIENLKARTVHLRLCTRFPMPAHAGQVFRNFLIQPLTANTTQATEGTVGSGITVTIRN